MKKLIWLYKKLISTKHLLSSLSARQTAALLGVAFVLVVIGCKWRQIDDEHLESTTKDSSLAYQHLTNPMVKEIIWAKAPNVAYSIGHTDIQSCNVNDQQSLKIDLPLHSFLGTFTFQISLPSHLSRFAEVKLGQSLFKIYPSVPQLSSMIKDICQQSSNTKIILTEHHMTVFQQWLTALASGCNIEAESKGYVCKLPHTSPEQVVESLNGSRNHMINRWSRQPYLLSRKLALADLLAKSLIRYESPEDLQVICKLVALSNPSELPIALSKSTWQEATCSRQASSPYESALIGLNESVREIEFLMQLFERTSKLGTLVVRLPRTEDSGGNIYIQLKPNDDVKETLTDEAKTIWTEAMKADQAGQDIVNVRKEKTCWHPLFGDAFTSPIAKSILFHKNATDINCQSLSNTVATAADHMVLSRYFIETIASETEFVVRNGSPKSLRLPKGTYSYTLQRLPSNPEEWHLNPSETSEPTSEQLSYGSIAWDKTRPRVRISN